MTRRPPCAPACPFIVTCTHCDWQSLWRCQVCQGPAHEGEVICTECAGQGNYTGRISNRNLVHSEGAVKTAPTGERLTLQPGPHHRRNSLVQAERKPDGYPE